MEELKRARPEEGEDVEDIPVHGKKPRKDVSSVLEKAKKALEIQNKLKQKLENLKKAKEVDHGQQKKQLEIVKPDELPGQSDSFFDPSLGSRSRVQRRSRPTLQFVEEGSLRKQAELARLRAEYGEEYVERLEQKMAQDGGELNMMDIEQTLDLEEPHVTPDVEWWDEKILVDKTKYPEGASFEEIDEDSTIRLDKITHYIEHPVEIEPVLQSGIPEPAPLKLTKKEVKKLRTQRRQAREAEKQELIRQGLLEPPKPKVKISNLMRVLGSEATADPTAIELEVSKQMADRRAAHDDRNLARMLTPAERREKKLKKLLDFVPGTDMTQQEIKIALYKIGNLSKPQHRFKVQINARENHLSGVAIVVPNNFSIVVVEGGPKTLRRFEKLMLNRIQWDNDDNDHDEEEKDDEPNYCKMVWTGIAASAAFKGNFKTVDVQSGNAARKLLNDHGVSQYWDLCASAIDD